MGKKYDVVIFDMDGTLTNTKAAISYCCNLTLRKYGLPEWKEEDVIKRVGYGLKNLVISLIPEEKRENSEFVEELLRYASKVYSENADYKVDLYEGIAKVLDACVDNDIKLAISTNKIQKPADKIVEKLMKRWDFTHIIGDDFKHPIKPNSYSVDVILKDLVIEKDRAIYVGDSESDIKTAKNAGIKVIGVDWGYRGIDILKENDADYVVMQPRDILEIIL